MPLRSNMRSYKAHKKRLMNASDKSKEIANENIHQNTDVSSKLLQKNEKEKLQHPSAKPDLFDELLSSSPKQEINFKPLSFWTKKLMDLESKKANEKKIKYELYDFSASEDTTSPKKGKKKVFKKQRVKKKKKQSEFPLNCENKFRSLKSKSKVEKEKSSSVKSVLKTIENKDFIVKDGTFKSPAAIPQLGITSTPAVKKLNAIDSSNFMFLSPILAESEVINKNTSFTETPKRQTPKNINVRTLRSRQILINK